MTSMEKIRKAKSALRDFFYGATVYPMIQDLKAKMAYTEYVFMTVTIGDMLGYPISSYYRYKILPYVFPKIRSWKKYLLREEDIV